MFLLFLPSILFPFASSFLSFTSLISSFSPLSFTFLGYFTPLPVCSFLLSSIRLIISQGLLFWGSCTVIFVNWYKHVLDCELKPASTTSKHVWFESSRWDLELLCLLLLIGCSHSPVVLTIDWHQPLSHATIQFASSFADFFTWAYTAQLRGSDFINQSFSVKTELCQRGRGSWSGVPFGPHVLAAVCWEI